MVTKWLQIEMLIMLRTLRVFSSVGLERYLDRVEVMGSNPLTPTGVHRQCELFFVSKGELLENSHTLFQVYSAFFRKLDTTLAQVKPLL